jgi:putative membrane protein
MVVSLLNEQQLNTVSMAIATVESNTDAELVTVLARRADNYFYIPALWAAMIALMIPLLLKLTPLWLTADELLMAQWLVFMLLAVIFRVPAVTMRLVPQSVKRWRAGNLARRQFLENNLHHTYGETGVLIFVSEDERYVEIIVDRGISRLVDDSQWQGIVDHFTAQVKAGNTQQGFIDCIERCGELLSQHVPATAVKDELPNHLIVI